MPYGYRHDPSVPDDQPMLLFDGHCVMCSAFARFILKHDRHATFRLAAAQSPLGQAIYRQLNLNPTEFETNILLHQGRAWFKSEGALQMFRPLGFPWSSFRPLRALPRSRLDRLYNLVARNRLKWFGRRE